MVRPSNALVKCTCSYKCCLAPGGYRMIKARTRRNHVRRVDQVNVVYARSSSRVRRARDHTVGQDAEDMLHQQQEEMQQQNIEEEMQDQQAGEDEMQHQQAGEEEMQQQQVGEEEMEQQQASEEETQQQANEEEMDEEQDNQQDEQDEQQDEQVQQQEENLDADEEEGWHGGSGGGGESDSSDRSADSGSSGGESETIWAVSHDGINEGSFDVKVEDQFLRRFLQIQALCDSCEMSLAKQAKLWNLLFEESKASDPVKTLSLVGLASRHGSQWDGCMEGSKVPTTEEQLTKLYRHIGLVEPSRWRLCTGTGAGHLSHEPILFKAEHEDEVRGPCTVKCGCVDYAGALVLKRNCKTCCSRCNTCQQSRKDMLVFEYLGFIPQIQLLVQCRTFAYNMLEMWRHRNEWRGMDNMVIPDRIDEFWHGSKVREYQCFWDPEKCYELPVTCPRCKALYCTFPASCRSSHLAFSAVDPDLYSFVCEYCDHFIQTTKIVEKGDPRNLGIMLHTDGFELHSSRDKSSMAMEIMILNTGKRLSLKSLPLAFFPYGSLDLHVPASECFSTFIQPLLEELEVAFMEGFDVDFAYSPPSFQKHPHLKSKFNMRVMLMIATGDHPAQCKLGGWKNRGNLNACRRDLMKPSSYKVNNRTVWLYDNNRYIARFGVDSRDCLEVHDVVKKFDKRHVIPNVDLQRKDSLEGVGLSAISPLWRLRDMYGFDMVTDLVYDLLHILCLNMFKKFFEDLKEDPTNQDLQAWTEALFEAKAMRFKEIRTGRWPTGFLKKVVGNQKKVKTMSTVGGWKAEDFQNAVQWVLSYLLVKCCDTIDRTTRDIGVLLIELSHIFYSYTRKHGWNQNTIDYTRQLLAAWRVRREEYNGPNSSILEHVAGNGEFLDDVLRHGSHDVFWCYSFEREVSTYEAVPTNNKLDELSIIRYSARTLLTKYKLQCMADQDMLLPPQRICAKLRSYMVCPDGMDKSRVQSCNDILQQCSIVVDSEKVALELWAECLILKGSNRDHACWKVVAKKGILVKFSSNQLAKFKLTDEQLNYVIDYWQVDTTNQDMVQAVQKVGIRYKSAVYRGLILCSEENVLLKDARVPENGKLKACIASIFSHNWGHTCAVFLEGRQLTDPENVPDISRRRKAYEKAVGLLTSYDGMNAAPTIRTLVEDVICKIMTYPHIQQNHCYVFERSELQLSITDPRMPGCCPPYPYVGDILLVYNRVDKCRRIGVVRQVVEKPTIKTSYVMLAWLKKVSQIGDVWVVEEEDSTPHKFKHLIALLENWTSLQQDASGNRMISIAWRAGQVPDELQ